VAKISKKLGLILILGLCLRLVHLGQSFWLDEASQAVSSTHSVVWIWSARANDFHPPLFYLFTHFWLIFNHSEVWLRLPSVLFGVANIYLIYLFSNHLFPNHKSAGLISAFLLAVNPFHIYYSQEFRSYMLLCLLGTLSLYLLHTRRYWWVAIINSLLFYTHYSSIFLFLAEFLYLLFYHRPELKKYFVSSLLFYVIIVPWLPQLYRQLISGINIDTYLPGWRNLLSLSPLKALPVTLFKLVAGRINFISTPIYLSYIVFVFAIAFLAFRATKFQRKFLFTATLTPIFLMILVSFIFPQNQPFRVIYILPVLILIFTQACIFFPKFFLTVFIYIAIVGNLAYFTRPRLQREQWRQAISFLHQNQTTDSAILVKFSDKFAPFYWYASDLPVQAIIPKFPAAIADVSKNLEFLSSFNFQTVYLLEYLTDLTDPQRHVESVLKDLSFNLTKTYDFPGVGFIRQFNRQ
jgi:uncharacterized membrane protein